MRLALKFIAALVLTVAGAVALRAAFDTNRAVARYEAEVRAAQRNLGEVLSMAVISVWESEGWEPALKLLERVERTQGDTTIRWVWLDEQPFPQYRPREPLSRLAPLRGGDAWLELAPESEDAPLVSYHAISLKGMRPGALELVHFTDEERAFVRRERAIQLATSGLVVVIYALLSALLGWRWVARPIQALVRHAQRVAEGHLHVSSPIAQRDEIGLLARAMNRMSAKLLEAKTNAAEERSARLETSRQLAHADRLASVGRLAAATAHDVGTPLNVIAGRAAMIAEGNAADAKDGARRIAEQAQRVIDLTRSLLVYARADDGRRETARLLDVVNEVVSLVAPLAHKAHVRLVVAPAGGAAVVRLNRGQIRQVLANLVTNAIQATPPRGRISLEVGARGERAFVAVRDEGAGISPTHLPYIFEPFFTTKPEGEGTGLGLTVCRALVEQHGGRIEVESEPNEGSTFTVWLPMGAEAQ